MSNIEQIDFSTLIWVKKELDETLNRAKLAIEEYVENPDDENQLQFCATYLHQVQGTLKMVELYGAAMVAEEMEQVAIKILSKDVDSEKDAFEVLMRGIILLPDYLERIQLGYKDIPMVLLPLVNDLRTVKGDQLLSESALFNPDLSLGVPEKNLTTSFSLSENQLAQVVKKIRSAYQICFLNWLKDVDVDKNLKKLQIIIDKLKTVIEPIDEKQLFWVAGGLFEALISGGLEKSVTVKQLAARLDQAIRMLTNSDGNEKRYYKELTNNLLYYVALADSKDRRINEIQTFFNLSNFISDDVEIENAQSSLSGKNRELLESVTSVIKEDLMGIQENLDLYNRNENATTVDLKNIVTALSKISDTLGIIGIGAARSKISNMMESLEDSIKQDKRIDKDAIMSLAETLIFVESSLDENIASLGEVNEQSNEEVEKAIPNAEYKKIMDSIAKESINNLQKIKQNFVQFIEAPWNKDSIESSPKLLSDISGALKMSGLENVATEVDRIKEYTTKYMLRSDYKPTVDQLDILAESVASLEYYLEYLSDGIKGDESILNLAKNNIQTLFEAVEKIESQQKQATEIDNDLDQMSDDDFNFDLDDDLEDDLEIDLNVDDSEEDYEELLSHSEDLSSEELEAKEIEEVSVDKLTDKSDDQKETLYVTFSEDTDDDIKEVFLEEFEEELEHLESIFPRWKNNPEDQTELLGEIRRIYHTLKGSGRLVGALAIGDYSWKIEEMTNMVLNNSRDINESYIQVMEKSYGILPRLYEALKNGSAVPLGYYEIIKAAEKVINGETITENDFIVASIEDDSSLADDEVADNLSDSTEDLVDEISDESGEEAQAEHEMDDSDDLSLDPVFVEILQQEVEGHLNEISTFLDNVNTTGNKAATEKFVRVIHTLNGAANMASVKSIVEMTTPLEAVSKHCNELNIDLDDETLDKIQLFKEESSKVMENLSTLSASNDVTNGIGLYFKNKLEQLDEQNKEEQDVTTIEIEAEDKSYDDSSFDLSQFLDDAEIGTTDSDTADLEVSEDIEVSEDLDASETQDDIEIEDIIFEDSKESSDLKEIEVETTDDDDLDFDLSDLESDDEELSFDEINFEEETPSDETDDVAEISFDDIDFDDELAEETTEFAFENIDIQEDVKEETQEEETQEEEAQEEEAQEEEAQEEEAQEEEAQEEETQEEETQEEETQEEETQEEETQEEETQEEETQEEETQEEETQEEETQEPEPQEFISAAISTSYDEDETEEESQDQQNEFDEELLEIFTEEANDILDRTEHVLSELEENPKDETLILALQRDLHTLKGGARMAGLENIGTLGHTLESLLENIGEENRTVDKNTMKVIHESFDLLSTMKDMPDFGQSTDITKAVDKVMGLVGLEGELPEESKLDQDYLAPIDAMGEDSGENDALDETTEKLSTVKKSNVLTGNQIKVNSELLDNLVNYAGEVSIYRSRLEQEIGSFRVNLSELGNTVSRIREQLRKLEAETEAQIISTFQTEEDDEGFDPLEMDRFSQLQQLSRSLAESVSDLTSIHSYLDDVARTSDNLLTQQSRVNTELQEGLMETRLVSFNSIVPRLRRLVRTTSNELNKPVKLEVHGAEGEMDKTVLEGVIAPLEHMLRNSLAHGIESDRSKENKADQGLIKLDVRREATEVVITVADDGAGINRKKVRKLALERGLIKKGAHLSDENIDRLILNSGFSTVEEVSKLAGRGVGMDVVSNQINLLGGSLDISSEPKQGTKFSIRLPYTLALSSALLVEIAETVYAIPVSGLEGIIRMPYQDYQERIKDKNFIYNYANEEYQLQELDKLLDLDSEVIVENNQIPLVMIRSGDNGVALRVDRILGSREIVVKTVGSQISSVPGIYGATILGDGNVVLILDIIPLSRAYMNKLESLGEDHLEILEEEVEKDPLVMIVDDSITMRKVGERILRRNNYDVVTAKDGLDALEQLKEAIPDVMLLDIEMPRMDGYELAIEMKKLEKYAHIPIIMITSRTGDKHRQKAIDLGVDRYLGKPYQEADLLENISELIEDSDN